MAIKGHESLMTSWGGMSKHNKKDDVIGIRISHRVWECPIAKRPQCGSYYQHVGNEVGHVGHGKYSYQSVGAVVGSLVSI